jgi:signal transduction histidine kinase
LPRTSHSQHPPRRIAIRKPASGSGLILQLFAFVFLPLTALLLVITFGSLALHQSAMRSMVTGRDERAVRTAASALRAQLEHRLLELEGLGSRAAGVTDQELQEVIQSSEYLLASFPSGFGLIGEGGEILAFIGNPEMAEFLASADLPSLLPELLPGEPTVGPAFHHSAHGELVNLAAIKQGDRTAVGVFSPMELAKNILEEAFSLDEHTTVFVVDASQTIIYSTGISIALRDIDQHPGAKEALEGRSGATYIQVNGGEQIIAYSPVQPAGWALVVQEAAEMVETPLLSSTQMAPLVLVPALLIALLALLFGARQVVGPLQALEDQAASLAWGDFEAIQNPVGGIAEIRSLQMGLIHLAEKVKAAQQSLHSYIGAITAGQEEERRRLARELHDDTLQGLIALKQRVQLFQIGEPESPSNETLREVEDLAEQTIQNLRRLTRALRPIYLEDLGLAAALEMLAQETSRSAGPPVIFHKIDQERRQPPDTELALYRIAQEALTNTARHAEATQVSVTIHYTSKSVVLEIADNGTGFQVPRSPAEFAPSGHFGLLGVHERAELIGAKLSITSSSGAGTRISVTLPDQAVD